MSACTALAGMALFACVARDPVCLPVERRPLLPLLERIVQQESRAHPWTLRDETEQRGLFFANREAAEARARELHARGHKLGLGWFQITGVGNWTRHWGSAEAALARGIEPCANLRAGADHLAADVTAALSRYNSGRFDGALGYAASVLRQAAAPVASPAPLPAPAAAPECPNAPPSWDDWATARHAAQCDRQAARRSAPTPTGDTEQ